MHGQNCTNQTVINTSRIAKKKKNLSSANQELKIMKYFLNSYPRTNN